MLIIKFSIYGNGILSYNFVHFTTFLEFCTKVQKVGEKNTHFVILSVFLGGTGLILMSIFGNLFTGYTVTIKYTF